MRVYRSKRFSQGGSVLLVTLFIACLFGVFLASYLYLVRQQKTLVVRSQAWNSAFVLAEAGVEEALAQLNPGAPRPSIDRTANGWGAPVNGLYGPISRDLDSGTYKVVYSTAALPIIFSTGYVAVPTLSANLTRVIRVTTTNVPLFTVAMAAKRNIDMNGNNVQTDSFDSGDPRFSTSARYDSTRASTNGDVACMTGILNVGNADVHGSLYLGATATNSIRSNGEISGGVENDFNFDFPSVVLPQTSWLEAVPNPQTIDGVSYQYVFTSRSNDYFINNLSGNVYVGTNSHIRLKLTGGSNLDNIRVAGPGADAGSLEIYMDGPSFTMSGKDTVDGAIASNMSLFGTTNCLAVSMTGNANFTGTVYAPQASFRLGGGGSSTFDFAGAVVASTITLNGHFNFHYDEALLRNGPVRGYAANSWREL